MDILKSILSLLLLLAVVSISSPETQPSELNEEEVLKRLQVRMFHKGFYLKVRSHYATATAFFLSSQLDCMVTSRSHCSCDFDSDCDVADQWVPYPFIVTTTTTK